MGRSMLCCVLLVAVLMPAGISAEPPQGIDAIAAYQGTWNINIERFDTAQSKAGHESSTLRNDCWKSSGYYACNQFVNGVSQVLLVFTYDDAAKAYTSHQIPPTGGGSGAGKLVIEGNVWTYPWQQGEGDKITYYRVVNVFTSPDTIEFRQEFSTDQKQWTVTARGHETRAK